MKFNIPYTIKLAPTLSHHWYEVWKKISGKPDKYIGIFPSATTILNAYPQSEHLVRWIADNGWNESQRIKSEAGERGTKVHKAVEWLLESKELTMEGYSLEEWHKINTFVKWYEDYKPEDVAGEVALFSPKGKYAGRVDRVMKINGELYVIDWKTSSSIHAHFPLQFSAYAYAIEETLGIKVDYTAALQLGAKNKNGYRFTIYPREEWTKHYKVFQNVKKVWEYDRGDPKGEEEVLQLPKTIKLLNERQKTQN